MAKRGRYARIPVDTFDSLQMNAGVVLTDFDPTTGEFDMEDILCATQNGLSISLSDETRDNGEGIDNCPKNMAELMEFTDRNASVQLTSVSFSERFLKYALSAADYDSSTRKLTPRFQFETTDFKDLWIVADKLNGEGIAFHLKRALSTNGVQWKTTDDGKGTLGLTLTGHYILSNQEDVPYEMYIIDEDTSTTYSVTQNLTHVTSSFTDDEITKNDPLELTLTADSGYTISTVKVLLGGIDVTSTTYDSSTGEVSIPDVSSNVVITATATED